MGKAETRLYSRARHILRDFHREKIPCIGVAGSPNLIAWDLDISSALRGWFRHSGDDVGCQTNFEQGVKLLHTAEQQLRVLKESEEETRTALAQWCDLLVGCSASAALRSFSGAARACEQGMNLVRSQILDTAGLHFHTSPELTLNYRTIDDIVAMVVQQGHTKANHSGVVMKPLECFHLIADVIYKQLKLRSEPFEWVYEGLWPLLIPEVFGPSNSNEGNKKIAPATLAITVTAVAHRLGLPALPFPAATPQSEGESTSTTLHHPLSPLLAARLASARQQGAVPALEPWVVGLFSSSTANPPQAVYSLPNATFLDAAQGDIVSGEQACARYPSLLNLFRDDLLNVSERDVSSTSVVSSWQSLCRTALVAHQRRGESDAVAQWLFVLLSLDPTAPEWDRALAGSEVSVSEWSSSTDPGAWTTDRS